MQLLFPLVSLAAVLALAFGRDIAKWLNWRLRRLAGVAGFAGGGAGARAGSRGDGGGDAARRPGLVCAGRGLAGGAAGAARAKPTS